MVTYRARKGASQMLIWVRFFFLLGEETLWWESVQVLFDVLWSTAQSEILSTGVFPCV